MEAEARTTVSGQAHPDRTGAIPSRASTTTGAYAIEVLGWVLPFALIIYLGLRGGGYDTIVRDQVGAAVWLAILVGGIAGILPAVALRRPAMLALGLLAVFAIWTATSAIWSDSVERSVEAFVLVATYLGIFALILMTTSGNSVRRIFGAVGAAISVIAGLALLSRLHPQWFPTDMIAASIPDARARLNYPLNSWNALAGLMAIGVPLLLIAALDARRLAFQAAATAAVPILALVTFYTLSRSGFAAATAAGVLFVALYPNRLKALPVLALAAAASAAVILLANQRDALKNNLGTTLAHDQGDEMLVIVLAVCVLTAVLRVAIAVAERRSLIPDIQVPRRVAKRLVLGAAAIVLAIGILAGGPSKLSSAWDEFKASSNPSASAERLQSPSGNGRFQHWESAFEAFKTEPLLGTGAGTFELWWARNGTILGYNRYAHSLYFETLAETGIIGLALIVALIATIVVIAVRRSIGAAKRRGWMAAGAASAAAFAVAVAFDWGWQMPVFAVSFLLVAAAIVQGNAGTEPSGAPPRRRIAANRNWRTRLLLAGAALPALVPLASSLVGDMLVKQSQSQVSEGDLSGALRSADNAASFQPYAAAPLMQKMLVLERQSDLRQALFVGYEAHEKDPLNWEPHYVLARIFKAKGNIESADIEYSNAYAHSPRSPVFIFDPDGVRGAQP